MLLICYHVLTLLQVLDPTLQKNPLKDSQASLFFSWTFLIIGHLVSHIPSTLNFLQVLDPTLYKRNLLEIHRSHFGYSWTNAYGFRLLSGVLWFGWIGALPLPLCLLMRLRSTFTSTPDCHRACHVEKRIKTVLRSCHAQTTLPTILVTALRPPGQARWTLNKLRSVYSMETQRSILVDVRTGSRTMRGLSLKALRG